MHRTNRIFVTARNFEGALVRLAEAKVFKVPSDLALERRLARG